MLLYITLTTVIVAYAPFKAADRLRQRSSTESPSMFEAALRQMTTSKTVLISESSSSLDRPRTRHFATYMLIPAQNGYTMRRLADDAHTGGGQTASQVELEQSSETSEPISKISVSDSPFVSYDISTAALFDRLKVQISRAAKADPSTKLQARLDVAEAYLALSLAPEAAGVLNDTTGQMVGQTKPREWSFIKTVDCILLTDENCEKPPYTPTVTNSVEQQFWQALSNYRPFGQTSQITPMNAAKLTDGLEVLKTYPRALQLRLQPMVLELLDQSDDLGFADRFSRSLQNEPQIAFGKALLLEKLGRTSAALIAYDKIQETGDRWNSVRAAFQALKLRVAHHLMTPVEAARRCDVLRRSWKGDVFEETVLMTAADWFGLGGDVRHELQALRDGLRLGGAMKAQFRKLLRDRFDAYIDKILATSPARDQWLETATILEANDDLVLSSRRQPEIVSFLENLYTDLDIPDRMSRWERSTDAGIPVAVLSGARPMGDQQRRPSRPADMAFPGRVQTLDSRQLEERVFTRPTPTSPITPKQILDVVALVRVYEAEKNEEGIARVRGRFLKSTTDPKIRNFLDILTSPLPTATDDIPTKSRRLQELVTNLTP